MEKSEFDFDYKFRENYKLLFHLSTYDKTIFIEFIKDNKNIIIKHKFQNNIISSLEKTKYITKNINEIIKEIQDEIISEEYILL